MKNFTMIPNELLGESQLPLTERYLYCVLLCYCGSDKDYCWPGHDALARSLSITPRQIRNLLCNLETQGFIKKTRAGWNRTNTYEVAKRLTVDRKSGSTVIGNMFPFHHGNEVPSINTYGTKKGKRSDVGFEKFRESMKEKGIVKK